MALGYKIHHHYCPQQKHDVLKNIYINIEFSIGFFPCNDDIVCGLDFRDSLSQHKGYEWSLMAAFDTFTALET